jgi:Ca2+/Na+ antiporter
MLFIKLKNILNILKTYKNIFIFLLFILIVYIIYKLNKNKNKNFETNSYLENYGNKLKSNIDLLSIKNSKQQKYKIQNIEYHPLIKKVSNVIIGRYKLKNKDIIKIVYYNVNEYILVNICKKDNKKNKNLDNILNDKYKLNEVTDKTTLNVSRILFDIVNDPLTKIFIGQYIINKSNSNFEINNIYKGIIDIAKNSKYSVDIRMNAVDILNLSNNKKYIEISKTLIQSIRNIRTENVNQTFDNHLNTVINNVKTKKQNQIQINKNTNIPQQGLGNIPQQGLGNIPQQNIELLVDIDGNTFPIPPDIDIPPLQRQIEIKKPSRSIYEDGQNVHNTKINESTLNTASELINKYNPTTRIEYTYYKKLYKDEKIKKIENSIHRINTDTSTFGKGFNLYSVFQSLLNLIEQHPQKNELNERLIDELIDMSNKCSTGHLSRLINVLQGFETNLKIKVEIDIKDEIYAKIKHLIEKNIMEQENMDEIMEDILSENKTIYIEFVKNIINDNISEMLNEYKNVDNKDVIKEIINALDKYTGTTNNFLFLKKYLH